MTLDVTADRPTRSHVTDSILNEISIPEKGIVSHTLFNGDNLKIVLFGFGSGHELASHSARCRPPSNPPGRGECHSW